MSTLRQSSLALLKSTKGTPGFATSSVDRPHEYNRYMGGHRRVNHPYITGYWYCLIEPPHRLFDQLHRASNSEFSNKYMEDGFFDPAASGVSALESYMMEGTAIPSEVTRWLHSTAESFSPPSRSLTLIEIPGLGGVNSSFLAGQELTRKFSITFREYQDLPILTSINNWTSMIDPHYGASPLHGNEYLPASYKGCAFLFLCKPSVSGNLPGPHADDTGTSPNVYGWNKEEDLDTRKRTIDKAEYETRSHEFMNVIREQDIEQFYFFEGVFPEAAPFDSLNSDIATNDGAQINVSFSFDGFPYGKEYRQHMVEGLRRLNNVHSFNFDGTFRQHMQNDDNNLAPEVYQFPFKSSFNNHIKPSSDVNNSIPTAT